MRGRSFVAAAAAAMLVWPCAAAAQQVTGLTATQDYGFTTLKWNPVAGATDYQIERTPVDANDAPTGAAAIVGVWQPQRTVTPDKPAFAESGYTLGGRYQWRVRARLGTANPQPYSAPVTGTTLATRGPAEPAHRLGAARRRRRPAARPYTSDVEEADFTAAWTPRATACGWSSSRDTIENRPMNMFIIGYPKPPDTAAAISAMPTYMRQLQRARQRAVRPRVVLDDRPPAGDHRRPGDPRDAEQDDGADRAVDQPGRPRPQHARQHHRAGPQPRPRAARAERDQGPARWCCATTRRTSCSTTTRATARTCRSSRRAT